MNSVFVVKVKITFSHLLKQAYTFWQISSQLSECLFFPRPGKIHSNICTKLTMYLNKRFSSLSIREKNDCERRKRTLKGIVSCNITLREPHIRAWKVKILFYGICLDSLPRTFVGVRHVRSWGINA